MNLLQEDQQTSAGREGLIETVTMKRSPMLPAILRASLSISHAFRRAILICAVCIPAALASQAAESYSDVVSKHLAFESEASANAEQKGTESPAIADLKRAVMDEVQMLPQSPQGQQATVSPTKKSQNAAVPTVIFVLAALLILGSVGYHFKRRFDSLLSAGELAEGRAKLLLADDPSLAAFFTELRDGLNSPTALQAEPNGPVNGIPSQARENATAAPDLLFEFYASVPDQLAHLRKLFTDLSHARDEASRHNTILEFLGQVSGLKELARLPELRPVWLMACAVEGLLKQLSRDTSEVTDSVLRTFAGAVDLLDALCVRGVNPNLATEPPVHLLAVDDDPISRLAISFALKKAFDTPDLATNGLAALALTEQQTYDVIFLDVDMPGMDGYELCTKIRQTPRHRTTPVVFVTRHGDFNSRSKSTLSGGESLIAKPFLAFEITVKALTLTLRGRLKNRTEKTRADSEAAASPAAVAPPVVTPAQELSVAQSEQSKELASQSVNATPPLPDDFSFPVLVEASESGSPEAIFGRAPAFLGQVRDQLLAAQHATLPTELPKFLGRLCAGIHTFNEEAERAELRAVTRLGSALEGMLRKLLKHPELCSPSALNAASAALELLETICSQAATNLDLTRSSVRILVVDDDPIARRAVSGSIQLIFGRPDNAEHGEAAVALAAENSFDLIFLDVLMPGMDGFAACKKIHKTDLNRNTPIVFITSYDDAQTRSLAVVSGGCGLIPKPFLASQITLTALTYILRARFSKLQSPALEATPSLVEA